MTDLAMLILRLTQGTLLAGHGAQKLFGAFGGPGIEGTAAFLEQLGLRPGRFWARIVGYAELGGGILTSLGALHPIGPLLGLGSMVMASVKAHAGKPIWVTSGGAELPVTNIAIQVALILAGPGRYSVDNLLGIRLPRWLAVPGVAIIAAVAALATRREAELAEAAEAAERLVRGESPRPEPGQEPAPRQEPAPAPQQEPAMSPTTSPTTSPATTG